MNKKSFIFTVFFLIVTSLFAQTFTVVNLEDDVYNILSEAENKGLCGKLKNQKPYNSRYISEKLEEIASSLINNKTNTSDRELQIVKQQMERFSQRKNDWKQLQLVTESNKDNFPVTFGVNATIEGFFSGGIYENSEQNSFGYEEWQTANFFGDLGSNVSFNLNIGGEFTKMPLKQMGSDYFIGNWWDETNGAIKRAGNGDKAPTFERYINTYRNYSVLPHHYFKHWDGSIYNLEDFNAGGLKGWPNLLSFGMTMMGGINASFLNGRFNIGLSRNNREWAAMDNGSSLALNANARPFAALEFDLQLLDWFSVGSMTGFLEFPNQSHINENAWYIPDPVTGEPVNVEPYVKDSYFFQSLFNINIVNFDFKYFHGDFGSVVIFPKRLELGYMLPLFEKVVYQNNVGDFDNLGLFGSVKGQLPGLGSIWISGYIDELNAPNIKTMYRDARCMYAWQTGLKSVFPLLPFGNLSFRYTKIEPFCYTHIAVRTPYTSSYTSTAYVNNGSPLGYYLEPNSDEFLFRLEGTPVTNLNVGFQYQLVRHGVTWGPGQVEGSSIYSELAPSGRDSHKKYFLKDGVYQWTSMLVLDGDYDFRSLGVPIKLTFSTGYISEFFTKSGKYNEPAALSLIEKDNELYNIYPRADGVVISVGCKFFAF